MRNRLLTLAATFVLVAVVETFHATPVMAQGRAAFVQDVDQPARAPFQATLTLDINHLYVFSNVPIPAGKRLVIDYVSFIGAAATNGLYIQPVILFNSNVAGNPAVNYYFAPNPSATTPGQYYGNNQTTIYSDSLSVAPAFQGYTPSYFSFNVVISGHLINP